MKKILFILALVIVAITAKTQTASWTMKTYNSFDKGTNYTLTNTVADTFLWYAPRNYPATQSYTVNYDTLSGPHATIETSLYGRTFDTDSWTQIGSTDTWTTSGTDPTQDVTITNATANRYNYYMVIMVGSGTGTTTIDRQQFYIWESGELSDGTATLSAGSFTGVIDIGMSGNLDVKTNNDSIILNAGLGLNAIGVYVNAATVFSADTTGDVLAVGGDITGANGNKIDIGEATDGTITFSRDDAGTVTLTSADNDANAALTISAGGTGALTLGDAGSTTAITSSDWAIDATGVATGLGNITSNDKIVTTDTVTTAVLTTTGNIIAGAAVNVTGAVGAASYNFATAAQVTGAADSIRVTNAAIPALAAGLAVTFVAEAANTAAVRFDLNGTVKDVYEQVGATPNALDANDIRSGCIVTLIYDGTQWIQVTPSGN